MILPPIVFPGESITLPLFDWLRISCMTTDNFCFYLQNRLIQTHQTGGQFYSDTSPFSIPYLDLRITLPTVLPTPVNGDRRNFKRRMIFFDSTWPDCLWHPLQDEGTKEALAPKL
jgi:hypothetical protein